MKIVTKYDETIHRSITTIYAEKKKFTGMAQAHEDDFDFASALTGQYISEIKALIKYYDYKAEQHLTMVKHLSNTYKHTKELKGMCEQIKQKAYEFIRLAKIYDNEVQDYIEKKDEYYKRIRDLRLGLLERTEFEYLPGYIEADSDDEQANKDVEIKNKRTMTDEQLWDVLGLDKMQ